MLRSRIAILSLCVGGVGLLWGAVAETKEKDPTHRAHRGKIVFQSKAFSNVSDAKAFETAVKTASKNQTLTADRKGKWPFHFIAFMRRAPAARQVNLVFYRQRDKSRRPVHFVEYSVGDPQGKMLSAVTTLDPANGFKAGDRVTAHITRLIAGREKRYATCKFTLR